MLASAPGTRHIDSTTLQPAQLDTDVLLQALVETKCHAGRTLEKLRAVGIVADMSQVIDSIKDHLPELKARMEVVATMELFSLMPVLNKTLVENLSALEPGEAVTAYMKLMDLITRSVGTQDINVNINDQRWKLIPRDLQQKFAALEASGQLQSIVLEHDPSEAA